MKSYLNEEVNCTEHSPSVRLPAILPLNLAVPATAVGFKPVTLSVPPPCYRRWPNRRKIDAGPHTKLQICNLRFIVDFLCHSSSCPSTGYRATRLGDYLLMEQRIFDTNAGKQPS